MKSVMRNPVKFLLLFVLLNAILLTVNLSALAQTRSIMPVDSNWRFLKGNAAGAEKVDFNDSTWQTVNVPPDWSVEGQFGEKNPTGAGGGYLPSGFAWYRKHFSVAEKDKNKRSFIEFDGVMETSDVFVNGVHLGKRPSGYISFSYDLTPHLKFGGENVVAVRADTSLQPASRWYTGAGIYRHVRLVAK